MPKLTNNPRVGFHFNKALQMACIWHQWQIRKDPGETPYIAHLLAVASLVLESGGSEEEAIAALLHDAVEDTEATLDAISDLFGDRISRIVAELSEDKSLPKPERKSKYAASILIMSPEALRVSLADKLHNLRGYFMQPELCDDDVKNFYDQILPNYANRIQWGTAIAHQWHEMSRLYRAIWD